MRGARGGTVLAMALALAALPSSLAGQLAVETGFEHYTFADPAAVGVRSITENSLHVGWRHSSPGGRLSIGASGAWARAAMITGEGAVLRIQGPTDTRLEADFAVAGPLRVMAIAVLPTGVHELDADQAQLVGTIASDLLPLRVGYWGSGGGGGGGVALARVSARSGISASAAYLVTRAFDPYAGGGEGYRAGNQLHARLVGYADLSASSRLTMQASYRNRGTDELAGSSVYRAGDQVQALAALTLALGSRANGMAYGGWLHRSEGERAPGFGDAVAPADDVVLSGVIVRLPAGRGVLTPSGDLRLYRNDAGLQQGYVGTLGVGWEFPVAGAVAIPGVRGRVGRVVVRQGSVSRFTGLDLGLTIRRGER